MASDEEYMRLALAAARKAGNATWRNPRVGSCLVKDRGVSGRLVIRPLNLLLFKLARKLSS